MAYGFAMVVVDDNNDVVFDYVYRGVDCVRKFLEELYKVTSNILIILNNVAPLKPLTKKEEDFYLKAKSCHICNEKITEFEIKVRDHNHATGI